MANETAEDLLRAETEDELEVAGGFYSGIYPSQAIRDAIERREIVSLVEIGEELIQPASLDLRLGEVAYRVRASFLPGAGSRVQEKVDALQMHRLDLTKGAVLEKGCVYIVPLLEALDLRRDVSGLCNPKSSTGRLDVFARVITDYGVNFDRLPAGYHGPLFAEVSPRTFSVQLKTEDRLVQLRLQQGVPPIADQSEITGEHHTQKKRKQNWVPFTVDVHGREDDGLVGYKAKKHAGLIDFRKIDYYEPSDYWDPVYALQGSGIVLDPDDFFILASKETVRVPPDFAAEMVAYDPLVGEFRVHYAGFFDPGFGEDAEGGQGARAVLEVRTHEVPFLIEDGQTVGRLVYDRMKAVPDKLYGSAIGSSYQNQGLRLGKHFKAPK